MNGFLGNPGISYFVDINTAYYVPFIFTVEYLSILDAQCKVLRSRTDVGAWARILSTGLKRFKENCWIVNARARGNERGISCRRIFSDDEASDLLDKFGT